jgi:drug/metabolite transporter (DMT)-like permease
MPLLAVGLVLVSCLLHAIWNLLLKRARDKMAFTALYLMAASILYLPVFLLLLPGTSIPPMGWLCILATGIVYFGYFIGLAYVYREGELSVTYPVMRGLGPALTFLGGIALLSEQPSLPGAGGVGLILLGAFSLYGQGEARPRTAPAPGRRSSALSPSFMAAVFVGVMYGLYSLIDKVSVGSLHIRPPVYLYLTYAISPLLTVPCALRSRGGGLDALRAEWRLNARACVAVGTLNLLAYLLVLYALSLPGAPVSYIVPLRTTSVLMGVLLGACVLGEGRLPGKLAAGIVMMAGITLIAWTG